MATERRLYTYVVILFILDSVVLVNISIRPASGLVRCHLGYCSLNC